MGVRTRFFGAVLLVVFVLASGLSIAERPTHCIFLLSKKRGDQRPLLENLKNIREQLGISKKELPVGEFGWDVPLHRKAIENALGLKEYQLPLASTGAFSTSGLPLRANRNRPALGLPDQVICYYLINEWARRADHNPYYFPYTGKNVYASPQVMTHDDGTPLVLVPAGPFWMGSTEGEIDELPPHTRDLPPYYIGQTEITVGQFKAFVEATGYVTEAEQRGFGFVWTDNWQKVEGATFVQPDGSTPAPDSHPVRQVTVRDAEAYCEWSGTRLPSEAEWEKAARGEAGNQYPWGNVWDASKAVFNQEGPHDVGSLASGRSPFGILDAAGNVREWTGTRYEPYDEAINVSRAGARNAVRGGAWNEQQPAHLRCSYRYNSIINISNDRTGFRVAKDFDSSIGLLP